jgi:hypothetical protein
MVHFSVEISLQVSPQILGGKGNIRKTLEEIGCANGS